MKVTQDEWDGRFMRMLREPCSWSKDPDKKVAALVVSPDRRRFTLGYNGLPASMEDSPSILGDKALKNELSVHAELNAILNAGTSLEGWTLYCTEACCLSCATAVMQVRILRVVTAPPRSLSRWAPDQRRARDLLLGHGVDVSWRTCEE